jgi:hypothetical protein
VNRSVHLHHFPETLFARPQGVMANLGAAGFPEVLGDHHWRTVSRLTSIPSRSRNFSDASVGPKSE